MSAAVTGNPESKARGLFEAFRVQLQDIKCSVIVAYPLSHFDRHARDLVRDVLGAPKFIRRERGCWEYADGRQVWFIFTGGRDESWKRDRREPVLEVTSALLDSWKGVDQA